MKNDRRYGTPAARRRADAMMAARRQDAGIVSITVRLSPELTAKLAAAARPGESRMAVATRAIMEWLNGQATI